MTKQFSGTLEFESPINKENSFGEWNLSKNAKSKIEVEIPEDGRGTFDWEVEELDEYESGSLIFQDNELIDYDGIFSLPEELINYLEENGYNVEYAKV